jgi:hypothetical protein
VADRIASDNDAIETHRCPLERVGRTDRPEIRVQADVALPIEETIRLSLSGVETHARPETDLDGETVIRGAFDNARLARAHGEGVDRLSEWVDDRDLAFGSSVLLDVVTPGFKYGLRAPGERVVYDATDAPDRSLSSIAESLGEE